MTFASADGTGRAGEVGRPPEEPLAFLMVLGESGPERRVPIFDQLFVGRECAGISKARRLVIDDPECNADHLEIRLDATADQAFVIDTSSNGTSLNGARLERAVSLPIKPGDEIRIADVTLTLRSQRFTSVQGIDPEAYPGPHRQGRHGDGGRRHRQLLDNLASDQTSRSWRKACTRCGISSARSYAHHGTLSHYAGDALFAVWEQQRFPDAAELAIDFALTANRLVDNLGPELPLRSPDGFADPYGMGCGAGDGCTGRHDQIGRRGDWRRDQRGVPAGRARRPPRAQRSDGDPRGAPLCCGALQMGCSRKRGNQGADAGWRRCSP